MRRSQQKKTQPVPLCQAELCERYHAASGDDQLIEQANVQASGEPLVNPWELPHMKQLRCK